MLECNHILKIFVIHVVPEKFVVDNEIGLPHSSSVLISSVLYNKITDS